MRSSGNGPESKKGIGKKDESARRETITPLRKREVKIVLPKRRWIN